MKKKILIILLSFSAILAFFAIRFARYYGEACRTYAVQGVKGELAKDMFRAAAAAVNESAEGDSGFTEYVRNEDGRIISINVNSAKVNRTVSQILLSLETVLNGKERDFGIPFWTAMGSRLLSGKGPEIPVNVIPVGSLSYELKSELVSGGINQTVHRISLFYSATVRCLAPFDEELIIITGETVIAETLVIGEVPKILFSS